VQSLSSSDSINRVEHSTEVFNRRQIASQHQRRQLHIPATASHDGLDEAFSTQRHWVRLLSLFLSFHVPRHIHSTIHSTVPLLDWLVLVLEVLYCT